MNNEMTMKEKRFSFFCQPTRKKSGKPTHIWHIAFCPTHEPTLRKSQRAKFADTILLEYKFNKTENE